MVNFNPIVTKTFSELTKTELYSILALRMQVFCVEQNCPYQDIDGIDQQSIHVFIQQQQQVCAYARIIPTTKNKCHIGRMVVAANFRKNKLATNIMHHCIQYCQAKFAGTTIEISAQSYLSEFYKKLGFISTGHYYLEDDIPHEQMHLETL